MIQVKDLQLVLPNHTAEYLVLKEFVEFAPYFTKVDDKLRTIVWLDDPNVPDFRAPATELIETVSWSINHGRHELDLMCEVVDSYAPLPDINIVSIYPMLDIIWTGQEIWANLYSPDFNITQRHTIPVYVNKLAIGVLVTNTKTTVSIVVNGKTVQFDGRFVESWKDKPLKFKFGTNPLADKGPIGSCCVDFSLVQITH